MCDPKEGMCVCVLLHVSEAEVVMSPDLPPHDSALCKTRLARKDGSFIAAALVSLFCCHKSQHCCRSGPSRCVHFAEGLPVAAILVVRRMQPGQGRFSEDASRQLFTPNFRIQALGLSESSGFGATNSSGNLFEQALGRGPGSLHNNVMRVDFPQPFLWPELCQSRQRNDIYFGQVHIRSLQY